MVLPNSNKPPQPTTRYNSEVQRLHSAEAVGSRGLPGCTENLIPQHTGCRIARALGYTRLQRHPHVYTHRHGDRHLPTHTGCCIAAACGCTPTKRHTHTHTLHTPPPPSPTRLCTEPGGPGRGDSLLPELTLGRGTVCDPDLLWPSASRGRFWWNLMTFSGLSVPGAGLDSGSVVSQPQTGRPWTLGALRSGGGGPQGGWLPSLTSSC